MKTENNTKRTCGLCSRWKKRKYINTCKLCKGVKCIYSEQKKKRERKPKNITDNNSSEIGLSQVIPANDHNDLSQTIPTWFKGLGLKALIPCFEDINLEKYY
ncbi:11114_t:CDS:2 [Diversispora eburnea]|uniref:11114_t:CDS:1 n=1 Tax=Diversispora eburnea TaxID=1213867 RepID=A0A9N9AU61_9GLOM|nr:11114_t:CDS:2 [Diversispora eburnea]